jgi:hypothetical protein
VAACVAHVPLGSVVPGLTFPQVPFVPPVSAFEQAWHCVLHALLQQKPSTQLPDWHCVGDPPTMQAAPCVSLSVHWCVALQ